MVDCNAVRDGRPTLLGCRLPMETSYRDFWELPYQEAVRFRLMAAFLQAKAVLAWLRSLVESGVPINAIAPVPRPGVETRLASIGEDGRLMQQRARTVEAAVYKVIGAVIAPSLDQLPAEAREEYAPFDIIEAFRVSATAAGSKEDISLQPLAILDDAHVLHPDQYDQVKRWLAGRELRLARWMLARFDALKPEEALAEEGVAPEGRRPGLTVDRDIVEIRLQSFGSEENRTFQRRAFRAMVKDMASRYLSRMPLFSTRKITSIADILSTEPPSLPPRRMADLRRELDARQAELGITTERRSTLEAEVQRYAATRPRVGEDVQAAMLLILMRRYWKRTGGAPLFPGEDPEPSRPVTANREVEESAELHLLHDFDRPFYYGPDSLCDASSENAEQFLHLAAILVDAAANQLSRSHRRTLTAARQNELLRQRAEALLKDKNFPYHVQVRRLAHAIGEKCRQETMEQNGWLRPNGYGILQCEFNDAIAANREFAEALQFGMAYNAWSIKQEHSCQGKSWALIELGGAVILQHGLSLGRGDFVKGTLAELRRWTHEPLKALGARG